MSTQALIEAGVLWLSFMTLSLDPRGQFEGEAAVHVWQTSFRYSSSATFTGYALESNQEDSLGNEPLKNSALRSSAAWISLVFHPFIISTLTLYGVQYLLGAPMVTALGWTALSFGIVILPMLIFLIVRVRRGRYQDLDVSVREDRYLIYILGAASFVLLLVLLAFLRSPSIVQATLQAALLAVLVGAVVNRFVGKISLHSLTLAACAVLVGWVWIPTGIVMGFVALLVGWSRIYLTRHTPSEVVSGWIVGIVCVVVWFLITRPLA